MLRALSILLPAVSAGLLVLQVALADRPQGTAHTVPTRLAGAALALSAGVAGLMAIRHGSILVPDGTPSECVAAALSTWIGQVIAVQGALAVLALGALGLAGGSRVASILAVLAAATSALRGHVIAAGESGPSALASLAHVTLASLWLAALAALGGARLLVQRGDLDPEAWRASLRAFSSRALPGMALLLATGVVLADRTVASGAALLATPYGQGLLVKLAAVFGALWCAGKLRLWLGQTASNGRARPGPWLTLEVVFAVAIVSAAGWVAASIPAAHDVIDWPFSFRVAPTAAWLQKGGAAGLPVAFALGIVAITAALAWRFRRRGPWRARGIVLAGLSAGSALAVPALSVDAYPTTYLHSPVPYEAGAVAAGARLYRQWCVDCHGVQGRGDGPLAGGMPVRPANLTEPHVQWHTHGDLYWWLTQGIPRSGMPGFRDHLSDDERWQLLNFLTALSLGHEARTVTETVRPRDPWLPAIDVRYTGASGEFSSLSEWRRRERPVLLAFADDAGQVRRLDALDDIAGRADVQAILVIPRGLDIAPRPAGWEGVVDTQGDITAAWSLYRRTLDDPDFGDERSGTGGLLFLIDRFGFVRARWTATVALPSIDEIAERVARLAGEPQLRQADIHGAP